MRFAYRTLCAAALVACADAKTPTTSPAVRNPGTGVDSGNTGSSGSLPSDARPVPVRLQALLGDDLTTVSIPPDGFSGASDAVHPDMACPDGDWQGRARARCWLFYTPYKNSDAAYENPAFLAVQDDTTWVTPAQVHNPIVGYPGSGVYNSDPDHAFDPGTHRLIQIYRVVTDSFNKIMLMSTANATGWTTPVLAFRERNHDAVSPALVIAPDRSARIWYVRSGSDGCSSTTTNVVLRTAAPDSNSTFEQVNWSGPMRVNLSVRGSVVWHLDVAPVDGMGYVALIVAYPVGMTCSNSDLWLATSIDGIDWQTYPVPILWRSMRAASQRGIVTWYRGTLRYDRATDSLHIWPSALAAPTWSVYHTGAKLHDLLNLLAQAKPSDARRLSLGFAANLSTIPMP